MSWFRRKPADDGYVNPYLKRPDCLDRPNDPDAYPDKEHSAILRKVPEAVAKRFAEEAAILSQLGLPVPNPRTQIRFEPILKPSELMPYYIQEVRVYDPQFNIPAYCDFQVRNYMHYTVMGDAEYFEAAKRDLKQHGLAYLIEHYPGVWTNRNPYHFYRVANKQKPIFYRLFNDGYPNFVRPALTSLPGLTAQDITALEHRINFFIALSNKKYPFGPGAIKYEYFEQTWDLNFELVTNA